MMPRSTSVVPPWIVSLGAIMVAKGGCKVTHDYEIRSADPKAG